MSNDIEKSEKLLSTVKVDKLTGVCAIKKEYIVEDHVRQLSKECLTVDDKQKIETKVNNEESQDEPPKKRMREDDRKDKLKGQNKARPPPFKPLRANNLCPYIMDQGVDEPLKKCTNQKCTFMHDRVEYMKIKPHDISEECHIFNIMGKCPRGLSCRMGSPHLTADGLNIVDKNKYEAYQKKSPSVRNQITKDLQEKLRKYKYNFSKAEKIIKLNNPIKKNEEKKQSSENEPLVNNLNSNGDGGLDSETRNADDKKHQAIGPALDTDIIKLLPNEKKKIDWRNKILLSPLTTVGNLPFRRICKEYGADITCGEMALAPRILKGAQEEWALIKRHESEDIFGVQICGNNPGVLTRCAQLLNQESDLDFIDLNLGCPIDLIYKQGSGCGMLNRANILETVVKSASQILNIPFTIKTRTGIYLDKPIAHNLMPKFRDWGVAMINIHGRSREQRYTKLADWAYIEKCAQAANPVPVYGAGDILSFFDINRLRNTYSTIAGVSIGRGALIKPWIFQEIKEEKLIDISSAERLDILKKYAKYGLEHWGSDTRGVETTRRFMLEWISFLHRYIPVGILEHPPQKMNERPPFYRGRDEMETLMASSNCADWIKISELILGKVPDGFHFLPKHKANSWK